MLLVVGGRSIDGCDARKEDCKCLENSRHVEWAGHQEAVGRSGHWLVISSSVIF